MPADKPRRPSKKLHNPVLSAMTSGRFAPEDFIIPPSDDKGHSARGQFRYPVSLEREVAVILASKLFPFVDNSDLFRWCVFMGLKALCELEDIPNSVIAQAEAAVLVGREVIFNQQYQKTFAVLDEAFDICRQRGAEQEFKRVYASVRHKFEEMPSGYWRDQYLSEMRRRWGSTVGDTGKAQATAPKLAAVVGLSSGRRRVSGMPGDEDDD